MNIANVNFKNQIRIARQFFIIAAIYGLLLRLIKVVDFIPVDYKNILQAHSHVTFLGWGFLAVISLIGFGFYPDKLKESVYLKRLFYLMALMLLGMLVSFPLQGYKLFSIVFLSVFLLSSYFYLATILKTLKPIKTLSSRFIKTGIWYYFLSSLAIWVIAIVTAKYGKTNLYYNAIYFYLHFLYNGFFVFALFGLLMRYAELKHIKVGAKAVKSFYMITTLACIPAYSLSLLWTEVPSITYFVGGFAGLMQIASLYYLYMIYKELLTTTLEKQQKWIINIVFVSYFIKIILQFSTAFPAIIDKAIQLKPFFIVGYIHLFTLGFMSLFIFLILSLFSNTYFHKWGMALFLIGFITTELLLFINGLLVLNSKGLANIDWLLFIFSAFMPVGLLLVYFKSTQFLVKDFPKT